MGVIGGWPPLRSALQRSAAIAANKNQSQDGDAMGPAETGSFDAPAHAYAAPQGFTRSLLELAAAPISESGGEKRTLLV